MTTKKLSYSKSGVDYASLDPIKKLAQDSAKATGRHLKKSNFSEVNATRGESAFVWQQGNVLMASVVEGLGTKNLVADAMHEVTNRYYYDVIGHDTVAAIINDLITVGAKPLVLHAYWATGDSKFLENQVRMASLIKGWKDACDLARVTWGGGETPGLKGIIEPKTIDLAGSAVGIIKPATRLVTDTKLRGGERIILLRSNGINANGLSLARAIARKLPKGYATKMPSGVLYGEGLLTKSNIYATLLEDLFAAKVDIHYLANITGHGLRKIMRARKDFTYVVEQIFEPQELFVFMQKKGKLTDQEMYQTFNMGQDYALFVPEKDVKTTLRIIKKNKFQGLDAGYVMKGEKQVVIEEKDIVYKGETLDLR